MKAGLLLAIFARDFVTVPNNSKLLAYATIKTTHFAQIDSAVFLEKVEDICDCSHGSRFTLQIERRG